MKTIDFDQLFEDYLRDWISAHRTEYTVEETEAMIPDLYEKFVTTEHPEIGTTPEKYFKAITDPDELVEMFVESAAVGGACSLLVERIMDVPECEKGITRIIETSDNDELVVTAMDMLRDMGADQPLDIYVKWIVDETKDESVAESAAEILKENAAAVKDALFEVLPKANLAQKHVIADVVTCAGRDDRTYDLLNELFCEGENIPYVAGLIARYGDEEALCYLYPALDDCNYHEYIEIRNAIETMGGVVDEKHRDFSDDPFYKAIKNLK